MKKNIKFIINPFSGGKDKSNFPELAGKSLDAGKFSATYIFTEGSGHAHQIAADMVNGDSDILVAVGGDGTVNEVASGIEGSNKIMGIIPFGSGNGLARSLGISLNNRLAVETLNKLNVSRIDSGSINGKNFFTLYPSA